MNTNKPKENTCYECLPTIEAIKKLTQCPFKEYNIKVVNCNTKIIKTNGDVLVEGNIEDSGNKKIVYWASNPANYTYSAGGSGMPFANVEQAFENTPNKGSVMSNGNSFSFYIQHPNAYYLELGTIYVPPTVYYQICSGDTLSDIKEIVISDGIPFRRLTHDPKRTSPLYYKGRFQLDNTLNQEQILRNITPPL